MLTNTDRKKYKTEYHKWEPEFLGIKLPLADIKLV